MESVSFHSLMDAARKGCSRSLGQLLVWCSAQNRPFARQSMGTDLTAKFDDSDLIQETSLDAIRSFPLFTGETKSELAAWYRRILRNTATDNARAYRNTHKRKLDTEVSLDAADGNNPLRQSLAVETPLPLERLTIKEDHEILERAFLELPAHHQEMIRMRQIDGLSFSAIATRLSVNAETARQRWLKAIRCFRDHYVAKCDESAI